MNYNDESIFFLLTNCLILTHINSNVIYLMFVFWSNFIDSWVPQLYAKHWDLVRFPCWHYYREIWSSVVYALRRHLFFPRLWLAVQYNIAATFLPHKSLAPMRILLYCRYIHSRYTPWNFKVEYCDITIIVKLDNVYAHKWFNCIPE